MQNSDAINVTMMALSIGMASSLRNQNAFPHNCAIDLDQRRCGWIGSCCRSAFSVCSFGQYAATTVTVSSEARSRPHRDFRLQSEHARCRSRMTAGLSLAMEMGDRFRDSMRVSSKAALEEGRRERRVSSAPVRLISRAINPASAPSAAISDRALRRRRHCRQPLAMARSLLRAADGTGSFMHYPCENRVKRTPAWPEPHLCALMQINNADLPPAGGLYCQRSTLNM
jgi:hypothetical protein